MTHSKYTLPAQFLEDPSSRAGFARHLAQMPDGPDKTWRQQILNAAEVAVKAETSVADALQALSEART